MASTSPLRRSSRHQNHELISEDLTNMNILAGHEESAISNFGHEESAISNFGHEESAISNFRKIDAYNEATNSNNSISPSKTNKASSPAMNGGQYPLTFSVDNGRVLRSNATSNSEIGPVKYTTTDNFSVDNGRDLRSNAKSNPENEPVNGTLPRNSSLDSGTVLRSNAKSYSKIEPINDTPPSNSSLDHIRVLRSNRISNPEIKPVNDSQPNNSSLDSGRVLGSKTESSPETEPVNDIPTGISSLDSGSVLRSQTKSNPEIQPVPGTPTGNEGMKSNSDVEPIHDTPYDSSAMKESNPESESFNNTQLGNPFIGSGTKRRGRKARYNNEYSAIRSRVRYLLTRMKYEQTLIDAYSGEGWKGQSSEKVRPQKEIDRAKRDISKFKLQIRGLFQRLDSSLSEGQIDSSLFDSEGRIDSENISCAKCNSKDVSTDNDIILCDGMCVRGFHQKCLNPPLLTENIPPGDDGWLCPACECKIDCVKLLNESQGGSITLKDTWEKVFPEAAEIRNGDKHNDGLPSYDCGYVPDNSKVDSEKKIFMLDDNLNPDSKNMDKGAIEDSGTSLTNLETITKFGEEILAELDRDLNQEKEQVLGKRELERLDDNKLHDETIFKPTSDSSDDENWSETYGSSGDEDWHASAGSQTPGKRKKYTRKYKINQTSNGNAHAFQNVGYQELHTNGNNSSASLGKNFYETVKQKLHESYLENQYPTREEKDSIARKLGIGYHQVHNWFNNTRRTLRVGPSRLPVPVSANNPVNSSLPKKRGRPRKIVPEIQVGVGSVVNQIDSGAYQSSFPKKRGRPRKIVPEIQVGEGSVVNQIDSGAYQSSLPMPNISNSYVNTEPTSVSCPPNQINLGAYQSNLPMTIINNSSVNTEPTIVNYPPNQIVLCTHQNSLPMPNVNNSFVNTETTSINNPPNKSARKEKMVLDIPLKEGSSIDQIDIKRQKAIARELKKMKQGR